jgi:antitoxin (DNA-binding transcriptional repressor) of toxin-antitoxin stability system
LRIADCGLRIEWDGSRHEKAMLAVLAGMGYIEFTMKNTLTVTQGQAQFPALCRRGKTSAITRNGEVVAFVVPRKRMAGLLEQMEILANPEAMAAIKRAKAGKTVDHPLDLLDEA